MELVQEYLADSRGSTASDSHPTTLRTSSSIFSLNLWIVGVYGQCLRTGWVVTGKSKPVARRLKCVTKKFCPRESNLGVCRLGELESLEYN